MADALPLHKRHQNGLLGVGGQPWHGDMAEEVDNTVTSEVHHFSKEEVLDAARGGECWGAEWPVLPMHHQIVHHTHVTSSQSSTVSLSAYVITRYHELRRDAPQYRHRWSYRYLNLDRYR